MRTQKWENVVKFRFVSFRSKFGLKLRTAMSGMSLLRFLWSLLSLPSRFLLKFLRNRTDISLQSVWKMARLKFGANRWNGIANSQLTNRILFISLGVFFLLVEQTDENLFLICQQTVRSKRCINHNWKSTHWMLWLACQSELIFFSSSLLKRLIFVERLRQRQWLCGCGVWVWLCVTICGA